MGQLVPVEFDPFAAAPVAAAPAPAAGKLVPVDFDPFEGEPAPVGVTAPPTAAPVDLGDPKLFEGRDEYNRLVRDPLAWLQPPGKIAVPLDPVAFDLGAAQRAQIGDNYAALQDRGRGAVAPDGALGSGLETDPYTLGPHGVATDDELLEFAPVGAWVRLQDGSLVQRDVGFGEGLARGFERGVHRLRDTPERLALAMEVDRIDTDLTPQRIPGKYGDAESLPGLAPLIDYIMEAIGGEGIPRAPAKIDPTTPEGLAELQSDVSSVAIEQSRLDRRFADRTAGAQPSLAAQNFNEQTGFVDAVSALAEDPAGIMAPIAMESLVQYAPALATMVATRSPRVGAAVAGTTSGSLEMANALGDRLNALGVNSTDVAAVTAALSDPATLQEVAADSRARAAIIALGDMASVGVASKVMAPARFTAGARAATNLAGQTVAGATLGGGSELLAQKAAGDDLNWSSILAEFGAEAATSPIEAAAVGREAASTSDPTSGEGSDVLRARILDPKTEPANRLEAALVLAQRGENLTTADEQTLLENLAAPTPAAAAPAPTSVAPVEAGADDGPAVPQPLAAAIDALQAEGFAKDPEAVERVIEAIVGTVAPDSQDSQPQATVPGVGATPRLPAAAAAAAPVSTPEFADLGAIAAPAAPSEASAPASATAGGGSPAAAGVMAELPIVEKRKGRAPAPPAPAPIVGEPGAHAAPIVAEPAPLQDLGAAVPDDLPTATVTPPEVPLPAVKDGTSEIPARSIPAEPAPAPPDKLQAPAPAAATSVPEIGSKPVAAAPGRPATSTKNAVQERERAERGADPILREAAQTNEATLAEAQETLAGNPTAGREVVERLKAEGPSVISLADEAVLLVEKVRLRKARDAAAMKASDEAATPSERAVAQQEWAEAEARINDLDQATAASGREWGRLGQFRQRMLREDFTFEALERRERVRLERPLTTEESASLREYAGRVQRLEAELQRTQEALDTATNRADADAAYKALLAEMAKSMSPFKPTKAKLQENAAASLAALRGAKPAPVESRAPKAPAASTRASAARAAVEQALGPAARHITVLNTASELPAEVADHTTLASTTEGIYDADSGRAYLFADRVSPERAAWVAAHEIAGHLGLRGMVDHLAFEQVRDAGKVLHRLLVEAGSNPTVRAIAQAQRAEHKDYDHARSIEEALAELAAAQRTGNYDGIQARYGVTVPQAQRATLRGLIARLIEALRGFVRALGGARDGASNARINQLLADAWRFAQDGAPTNVGSNAESRPAKPFFSALARSVEQAKGAPKRADSAAWKGWLDGAQRRGEFKQAERDWLGVDAWLDGRGQTTRDELAEFVRTNAVQVEEVVLTSGGHRKPNPSRELQQFVSDVEFNPQSAADWDMLAEGLIDNANDFVEEDEVQEAESYTRMAGEARTIAREMRNAGNSAKFGQWQLPGGQNYKELLLTLPRQQVKKSDWTSMAMALADRVHAAIGGSAATANGIVNGAIGRRQRDLNELRNAIGDAEADAAVEAIAAAQLADHKATDDRASKEFRSGHFDQPNVLAHVRFNERTDADGKRVLFIEEIQSDWHQKGRRQGYGKDIPNAPLKGSDEWGMLAFKRAARWAIDNGFDRISWTTGDQQNARYDLALQVDSIDAHPPLKSGVREVTIYPKSGDPIDLFVDADGIIGSADTAPQFMGKPLDEVVGKDMAEKIMAITGDDGHAFKGVELAIGGEGMRGFYDKILPSAVKKWAKPFGATVGTTQFDDGIHVRDRGEHAQLRWQVTGRDAPATPFATEEEARAAAAAIRKSPQQHSVDVNDAMRASVGAGQPLFSRAPIDPTQFFHLARIGALPVSEGVADVEAFKSRMKADLGDELYASVESAMPEVFEAAKMQAVGRQGADRPIDPDNVTHRDVVELARKHIQAGVRGEDAVMKAVTSDVQAVAPKLTDRDVRRLFSEYGKTTIPSKEADKVHLRELRSLVQIQESIDRLTAGLAALKSGPQRDKATQAIREKRRILNDLLKVQMKSNAADPEKLATYQQARIANLQHQIEDLTKQIATGERPVRPKPAPPSPEVQALIAARDALQREKDAIDNPRSSRENEAKKRALAKQIEAVQAKLAGKAKAKPGPVHGPDDADVTALKDQLASLRAQVKALERPTLSPDQRHQNSQAKSIARQLADVEARLKANDYSRRTRPEPKELNEANKQAKVALMRVKAEFARRQFEDDMAKRHPVRKVFGGVAELFNLSRAYLTSVDFSALLRQGGFIAYAHPVRAAKAVPQGLRAFASEAEALAAADQIFSRPNAAAYKKFGLELTQDGGISMTKMEEQFMSRWLQRMPRLLGGGLVRGSSRAFTTVLNRLRADSFDAMAAALGRNKVLTEAEGKAIANFINVATGRGHIGTRGNAGATGLNVVFFAPRLVASRFNLLALQPLYGGTARTRALILAEYARFLMGVAVVFGLAALAADDDDDDPLVTMDPRSSNFLKIKFNNTYIDPMTGLSQVTVFLARMLSGETVTGAGAVRPLRDHYRLTDYVPSLGNGVPLDNELPYGSSDAFDVAASFARTKFAPIPGAIATIGTGTNVIGEPVSPGSVVVSLVVPIGFQDVEGIMTDNGTPKGAAIFALSLLGMGVQYRDPNTDQSVDQRYTAAEKDMRNVENELLGRVSRLPEDRWDVEFEKLRAEHPEILDGLQIRRYVDNRDNQMLGRAGMAIRKEDGSLTLIRAEGSEAAKPSKVREVMDKVDAVSDVISDLRKGDQITLLQLRELQNAGSSNNVGSLMAIMELNLDSRPDLSVPASPAERRAVLAELENMRTDYKRTVLDMIEGDTDEGTDQ